MSRSSLGPEFKAGPSTQDHAGLELSANPIVGKTFQTGGQWQSASVPVPVCTPTCRFRDGKESGTPHVSDRTSLSDLIPTGNKQDWCGLVPGGAPELLGDSQCALLFRSSTTNEQFRRRGGRGDGRLFVVEGQPSPVRSSSYRFLISLLCSTRRVPGQRRCSVPRAAAAPREAK